ncbi:hypothetical protein K435DRAFT_974519 [Dendrothele bispora CBS 962.96]|uniref:Heterokaryon incompatibility domain-containing protein n=1 Tax=Dendrothele bispora (strain CBS 962.96) TaxID=1314807 RepID=A0A4S8KL19_DENBC|nr:hypothetical protein K435DRAFT_974519 [Dendrothele bispora CBS 962.96]
MFPEDWKKIVVNMGSIRIVLSNYSQGIKCSRKHSQLPERPALEMQSLSSALDNTTHTLKKCLQRYRIRFSFLHQSLFKQVKTCDSRLASLLETLQSMLVPKSILQIHLEDLVKEDQPLDIAATTPPASPQRYRLVRCDRFTQDKVLCIDEFIDFPHVEYTAISYVWRGNPLESTSTTDPHDRGKLTVKDAEDADPIGIDALDHACRASLSRGYNYLWLDRLCILQTSPEDKNWQIKQMHSIYQFCSLCIVLAGGVQRLVRLDEETSWIHRGWTLQEAVAPPVVSVLFFWKLGSGQGSAGDLRNSEVKEIVHQQSAMASLSLIINTCVTGSMSFSGSSNFTVEAKMFSSYPSKHSYNDIPFWRPQRKLLTPNVAALAIITDNVLDNDAKEYAIWQSALMRTSSRPVDMVFSIMGLFGITLDTSAFHKNDRIGATIALASEILKRGGRASWLGASFRLDPCKEISTFPIFPQTRVAGRALVSTINGVQEVSEFMASEYPYAEALVPFPKGSMDSDGYLTFTSKAVEIVSAQITNQQSQLTAMDGSIWETKNESSSSSKGNSESIGSKAFAVLIGWFNGYYPGATPAQDANNIRAMLIQEHSPGKFHVQTYFSLSMKLRKTVLGWEEGTFCVGGPDERQLNTNEEELHETSETVEKLRLPTSSTAWKPTVQDKAARLARWAVPQQVLERHHLAESK